jgi:hypothetical protein
MKKLLPLAAIFLLSSVWTLASSLPSLDDMNASMYRTYFQPGQDQTLHEVELYPNPVTDGHLTITSTESILSVQILNITGKIVFNQEFQPNTNSVDLELDKLEKGIYLVRIGFAGKEVHTEKVMIK